MEEVGRGKERERENSTEIYRHEPRLFLGEVYQDTFCLIISVTVECRFRCPRDVIIACNMH